MFKTNLTILLEDHRCDGDNDGLDRQTPKKHIN